MQETGSNRYSIVTDIIDNKFSEDNTSRYQLQIVLNHEYFAFSISTKQGKLLRVVEIVIDHIDWEDTIHYALKAFPFLYQPFLSTNIKFQSFKHSIIPSELFDENAVLDTLNFIAGKDENKEFILHDHLIEQNSHLSYSIPESIYSTIKEWFPKADMSHSASPFISHLYDIQDSSTTQVYCNVNISNFELIVFRKGKLLFYNHFPFTNEDDLLYYLLFTYEQLSLNPEKIPLYFIGKVSLDSPIYELAYKYVYSIEIMPFHITSLQGELLEEYIPSEFYNVLV